MIVAIKRMKIKERVIKGRISRETKKIKNTSVSLVHSLDGVEGEQKIT